MAHIDPRLERNQHFATTGARGGAKIVSKHPITCPDPRTDPSASRGGGSEPEGR